MSKKVNPVFAGVVKNGKIVLDSGVLRKRFEDRLRLLEGKKIELVINKYSKKRSLNQNDFYWGAIIPMIADQVGMLNEEVHEALRMMFLKDNSKKIETIKSTSELTKGEFVEYLMNIEIWAAEFLKIENWPDPEQYEINKIML